MNRRHFIAGVVTTPAVSALSYPSFPVASLVTEFLVDSEIEVQMRISAHLAEKSAEVWRRNWNNRAFEHHGEWYLDSSEQRDLPDDLAQLPGNMYYYRFTWGEAAEEDSILTGTFRRQHISCVFRLWGDHEPLLLELGEWFEARKLPDPWELMWSNVQLESFVPTSEEFGHQIDRHDNRSWF